MTLQIEAGKYYRTRDWRKVGPMNSRGLEYSVYWHKWECPNGFAYCDNGRLYSNGVVCNQDLIAEWTDEPARPAPLDLAALAAKHGIRITVTAGEMSMTFDGME